MPSLTLAVPAELRKKMNQFPEINWSEVARHAILDKMDRMQVLERMNKILAKSELTEADAIALGRRIKQGVWRRHRSKA